MTQATKEQLRRQRTREYEAALDAARSPVGVMELFVRAREARSSGQPLEEAFAATALDGPADEHRLPSAVWVALRQGDVGTTIEALIRATRHEFLLDEHQELDAGYRLTTIEERRGLPDVELLQMQLAAFLQVPADVIAVIAGWGPEDPRTAAEVDTLLEQRFGPGAVATAPRSGTAAAGLAMSSAEFTALLNLTPQQRGVLSTLVRQSDITIVAGG